MNRTYDETVEHKDMYFNVGYTCDILHDFGLTHPLKNYDWYGIS